MSEKQKAKTEFQENHIPPEMGFIAASMRAYVVEHMQSVVATQSDTVTPSRGGKFPHYSEISRNLQDLDDVE